jgi:hypothetical protein
VLPNPKFSDKSKMIVGGSDSEPLFGDSLIADKICFEKRNTDSSVNNYNYQSVPENSLQFFYIIS